MPQTAALDHADDAALLRLCDAACVRGGRMLWRGVTLTLTPGALVQVAGANGSGKSSLLRVAAGFLPVVAGTVECTKMMGLVDVAEHFDSDRNLDQALDFYRIISKSAIQVATALSATGIAHLAQVPVRMLSTGQRKRAALARLLLTGAPLWLLDEPANGLDADGVAMLAGLIATHRATGGAVLMASHQTLPVMNAQTLNIADYAP